MNSDARRFVTLLAGILMLTACRPPADSRVETAADQPASPPTACDTSHEDLAEQACALVPAWQSFDPEWLTDANVVVVGELHEYDYPCIFNDDGSSDMILARGFQIQEILMGDVQAPEVNLSMGFDEEQNVPGQFVEGRTYLIVLKASQQTLTLLSDPDTIWGLGNEPHASEVLVILDLSQTEQEAEALSTQASLSGELDGVSFSPESWEALRSSDDNDLAAQKQFLGFISDQVLVQGASLKQVRMWLGEPDWWWMNADGISHRWNLNRKTGTDPVQGMISIRIEAWFGSDLTLRTWRTEVLKCTRADDTGDAWSALDEDELVELGLEFLTGGP